MVSASVLLLPAALASPPPSPPSSPSAAAVLAAAVADADASCGGTGLQWRNASVWQDCDTTCADRPYLAIPTAAEGTSGLAWSALPSGAETEECVRSLAQAFGMPCDSVLLSESFNAEFGSGNDGTSECMYMFNGSAIQFETTHICPCGPPPTPVGLVTLLAADACVVIAFVVGVIFLQ